MAVKKVKSICPHCGGREFVRAAYAHKQVYHPMKPISTYHTVQVQICKRCGSIVREFIMNPDAFPDY